MANNDSIFLYQNGESRALKLKDLNSLYYIDANRNLCRKSDDLMICHLSTGDIFVLYPDSIYEATAYREIIDLIVEYDSYTSPTFQGGEGLLPKPPLEYNDEYGAFFKLIDKNTTLEYFLSLLPSASFSEYTGYWSVVPWYGWYLCNKDGSIQYTNFTNPVGRIHEGLQPYNPNAEMLGGCGFIYDSEGRANVIFANKVVSGAYELLVTNEERLTNAIKNHHSIMGALITNLSFNLVDSETFEYGEESSPMGYGGGSFDNSSDYIGIPDEPTFDFTQQGCGKIYRIYNLRSIIDRIFPNIEPPSGIDAVAEWLGNMFELQQSEALKQYIVDAYAIPVVPQLGDAEPIQIGWKNIGYPAQPVTKQWVTFSCGKLKLEPYFDNFEDYNSQFKLFLPFIGFVDINPEFAIGTLEVIYRFDCVSGEFMCYVLSNSKVSALNSVIGQYSGNAITHIPINAVNNGSKLNGILEGVTNITGGLTQGYIGDVGGGSGKVAQGIADIATSHPTASLSNAYSGSSALMGIRTPFLLIARPVTQFSKSYRSEVGLPLNVSMKLSDVQGFTICQIDDIGIENATNEECEELVTILRSGIIL